jgi:hypothetical protein
MSIKKFGDTFQNEIEIMVFVAIVIDRLRGLIYKIFFCLSYQLVLQKKITQ